MQVELQEVYTTLGTRYMLYLSQGKCSHSLVAHSMADYSSRRRLRGKNCANHTVQGIMERGV